MLISIIGTFIIMYVITLLAVVCGVQATSRREEYALTTIFIIVGVAVFVSMLKTQLV